MKTAGECRRFFVFRATLACSRCRLRLRLRLQSLQLGDCDSIFGECRIALVLDPLEVRESLLLAALEGVAQAEHERQRSSPNASVVAPPPMALPTKAATSPSKQDRPFGHRDQAQPAAAECLQEWGQAGAVVGIAGGEDELELSHVRRQLAHVRSRARALPLTRHR